MDKALSRGTSIARAPNKSSTGCYLWTGIYKLAPEFIVRGSGTSPTDCYSVNAFDPAPISPPPHSYVYDVDFLTVFARTHALGSSRVWSDHGLQFLCPTTIIHWHGLGKTASQIYLTCVNLHRDFSSATRILSEPCIGSFKLNPGSRDRHLTARIESCLRIAD